MKTWIKQFTSAYNGSSWIQAESTLPTQDYYRAVAINSRLLCLAGAVDADGTLVAESGKPLSLDMLARLLRLQAGDVKAAINDLCDIGILAQDTTGTYYYPEWGTYQSASGRVARSADDKREYERTRKAAYRALKKVNMAPEAPGTDSDETELEAAKEHAKAKKAAERAERAAREKAEDDLFDEWWTLYPRKTDKANARKEWAKLAKDTNMRNVIVATRALLDCETYEPLHGDKAYIPYPSTWLHGRRFEDINDLQ